MKRGGRALAVIALGLIAGAFAFLPAALLDRALERALPTPARADLTGTFWEGRGVLRLGGETWPLAWSWRGADLLRMQLGWEVELGGAGLQARAALARGFGGVEMRGLSLRGELASLAALAPQAALAGPTGTLSIEAPGVWRVEPAAPWRAHGEAVVRVGKLALAALGGTPLGEFEVRLEGKGEAVEVRVVRSEGALLVEGQGRLTNAKRFTFVGSALPLASMEAETRAQLARLAPLASDGRHRLALDFKW